MLCPNGAIIALITAPIGLLSLLSGEKGKETVTRQRTTEPYIQQKITIPATLAARFSRFHWDAAKNKVQYGAISKIVTELLSDYVNKLENPPPLVPEHEK